MKHQVILMAAALALTAACPLAAQTEAGTSRGPSASDQAFLRQAATAGATEVAMGKQALTHVQSPQARQLAQRMVDDHTNNNRQLADLAKRSNVDVSASPDQAELSSASQWSSLQGKAYEQAYAKAMVTDHQKAIALFTQGTQSSDADVRRFAQNTLPVLKDHLAMATALANGQGTDTMESDHRAAPQQGDAGH